MQNSFHVFNPTNGLNDKPTCRLERGSKLKQRPPYPAYTNHNTGDGKNKAGAAPCAAVWAKCSAPMRLSKRIGRSFHSRRLTPLDATRSGHHCFENRIELIAEWLAPANKTERLPPTQRFIRRDAPSCRVGNSVLQSLELDGRFRFRSGCGVFHGRDAARRRCCFR